jgi:hypothetical protein
MNPRRPNPSAPPVYRPNQASPQMKPAAPPVYRPQPSPMGLQPEPAIPTRQGVPTAGRKLPTGPPVSKPGFDRLSLGTQQPLVRREPIAPQVYRPKATPGSLQGKMAVAPKPAGARNAPMAPPRYGPQLMPISRCINMAVQLRSAGTRSPEQSASLQRRPQFAPASYSAGASTLQRAAAVVAPMTDEELEELLDYSEDALKSMGLSADEKRRFGVLKSARAKSADASAKAATALESLVKGKDMNSWDFGGETYHINLKSETYHVTKEGSPKKHYFFAGTGTDITDKQPTAGERGRLGASVFSSLPKGVQEFIKTNWDSLV